MPSPPAAEPKSEPDELPVHELDEYQNLIAWEFLCLLDLGFDIAQATALVHVPHFSWHTADALLKRGWPHETVTDELT